MTIGFQGKLFLLMTLLAVSHRALATEMQPSAVQTKPPATKASEGEPEPTENARMRALEGSKSPWSLQLNLTYTGSMVDRPFSDQTSNPGNQVPPPVVYMNGLIQGRYRIDPARSIGFGGGITVQTPFQHPQNTTLADPIIDFAYSKTFGALHNRVDASLTSYTSQNETAYGYLAGATLEDDMLWSVGHSKFTLGLTLATDYNVFSNAGDGSLGFLSQQKDYDLIAVPFAEYAINKHINLRSVGGFIFEHYRSVADLTFKSRPYYQTAGLGIAWTQDFFTYFYVRFYPSPLNNISSQATNIGFNLILNLSK